MAVSGVKRCKTASFVTFRASGQVQIGVLGCEKRRMECTGPGLLAIMTSVPNFVYELLWIPQALAQPAGIFQPASCNFQTGITGFDCIRDYISVLTGVVIGFCASICLVRLMVSGFQYMMGPATGGSSDEAKKNIINALLGLAVCLLTYIIIETVVVYVTG